MKRSAAENEARTPGQADNKGHVTDKSPTCHPRSPSKAGRRATRPDCGSRRFS